MPIEISDLASVWHGIERPEHVAVSCDGRLFASDKGSAVAEILGKRNHARGHVTVVVEDAGR